MATQTRVPTGTSATAWTANGAATTWECVDDTVGSDDGDTTYMSITVNANEHFTITAPTIGAGDTVNSVATSLVHKVASGSVQFIPRIIVNASAYSGSTTAKTNTTYELLTETWLTNPDTGLSWVVADVNGTGSNPLNGPGVRAQNVGAGEVPRITSLYLTIDYTEAGGSAPKTLLLLGVG